ncbi:TfuA-related McrA-glycine thioamidation protein [Sphaerisporangium album]|uniref:TfuA-related McrA-glycine thioamidation protein n=1 Tax=Sphaerisporangium album TaxID=509200 RepID=A0A367F9F6_9ACTN|nr:TfuA-like protein [Sphaerisporangium album]RCG26482.1 TfuA-related McrA-glycine thioamidation protein [Sphaerisporangium album]
MTTSRDVIVFAGPSFRPADLARLRELAVTMGRTLEVRPPVRRGDLLDLADGPKRTAVIIDGEFGQRLAVSIAEVRAVLATGQPLTGASSMGALRAVECRTLGMTGTGWIYRQYLDGTIDSDGDVALLYDPEDFAPVTIPLVNVRWLLKRTGLPEGPAEAALRIAHGVHFRDRRPSVLLRAWERHLPEGVSAVLLAELSPDRRDAWDRKRLDALAAVRMALGLHGTDARPSELT